MDKIKSTITEEDFWACESCKIDSNTKDRWIPCPRGSCEAKIIGKKVIEVKITENEKSWFSSD